VTSQELEVRQHGALETKRPRGARQLGARVKPIIRLGMGVKVEGKRRDGSTYTRPDKTDYFTVRGDERAVAKFRDVYGEKPKAVKIMVPSSLELALDISYRSFIGGQDDPDGGRPLALGMTNFAPLGYVGGADVLRVWRQDGSYDEVETEGLDELGKPLDEIAKDLGVEVHATFTFTIPEVLGWGSFAQVTSKGKKSADNLAFKLNEIYSAFGAKAPWAFDREEPPLLTLKPDSALMRFEEEGGKAKWGKTKIYVLDIVIPESFEDMRDRLAAHQASLPGGSPQAALYGPARGELVEGSATRTTAEDESQAAGAPGTSPEGGADDGTGTPAAPGDAFEGAEPGEPATDFKPPRCSPRGCRGRPDRDHVRAPQGEEDLRDPRDRPGLR
jgi:hypothetical protein